MTETSPEATTEFDLSDLADRIVASAEKGLPPAVVREAVRSLQNIVSTAIGGMKSPEVGHARKYFEATALGDVVVPGSAASLSPHAAALLIGLSAHLDDFDDTHVKSSVHASAAAFSAAWVAAQMSGGDPHRFFSGFAHGCEIQLRVAWGMMPWHYDRGWHITGTVGALGAAVAAGVVYGLTAAQLTHALGFACSQSVGVREAFGTSGKPFHPGKAAANGVLAVELARAGFTASPHALLGARGYYAVLSDRHDAQRVQESFGDEWLLLENTYKPYPCGLVVHPLIDLGMVFREQGIEPGAIERVEIHAHPIVRELTGNPEPRTPLEARFSGVHGFAMGLVLGKAGLPEFDRVGLASDAVAEIRRRTALIDDEALGWTGSSGTIVLKDGRTASARVPAALGSLERPLSDQHLHEKFLSQVQPVLAGRADVLWAAVKAAPDGMDFGAMLKSAKAEHRKGAGHD